MVQYNIRGSHSSQSSSTGRIEESQHFFAWTYKFCVLSALVLASASLVAQLFLMITNTLANFGVKTLMRES